MANVELELLSNIIRDGDLSIVRRMGFNAALLQTEEARDIFRFLMDAFTDPKKPGTVPSLERVRRRFPEFDYCPTRDTIEAQTKEVVDNNVKAGIRATVEEVEELLDEGEDPQLVLGAFLPTLRDLVLQGGANRHLLLSGAGAMLREDYEQMQKAGGITGIPFPWAPLNQATAGMQPEDFIIIYGRPKNMKTWVACAIAAYAYSLGYRVLVYSKEMSAKIMARRIASIICKVDYEQLKTGTLSLEDEEDVFGPDGLLDQLVEIEKHNQREGRRAALSFISDRDMSHGSKGVTVDTLSAEAERFEADLVIVDGFYLMKDGRTNQRSREWKQISNISSDLKDMAQRLRCTVVGTTQANRGAAKTMGEDQGEVAYADAIDQDCDLMMRVFKSKNLATGKPKIMLTFPGTRDSVANPFVINAWPGKDFSVLQSTVDVEAFLKDKKVSDDEEEGKNGKKDGGGAGGGGDRFTNKGGGGRPQRQRASNRIRE